MVSGKNFDEDYDGRKSYETQVYTNEQKIDDLANDKLFLQLNLGKEFCSTFYAKEEAQAKSKISLTLTFIYIYRMSDRC